MFLNFKFKISTSKEKNFPRMKSFSQMRFVFKFNWLFNARLEWGELLVAFIIPLYSELELEPAAITFNILLGDAQSILLMDLGCYSTFKFSTKTLLVAAFCYSSGDREDSFTSRAGNVKFVER